METTAVAMLAYIVNTLIDIYLFVVIASVILSWLIGFNVINRHNQVVDMIWRTVNNLTEPALRPIRNFLPSLGGLDISPIILLVGLNAAQIGLNRYVFLPMMARGL